VNADAGKGLCNNQNVFALWAENDVTKPPAWQKGRCGIVPKQGKTGGEPVSVGYSMWPKSNQHTSMGNVNKKFWLSYANGMKKVCGKVENEISAARKCIDGLRC
jgi:hypothetical protein